MTERRLPLYQKVAGLTVPGCFNVEICRKSLQYQPRDQDLFIASYPKTGTTWTQMIVFAICSGGKPPLGIPDFSRRIPFLEMYGSESLDQEPKYYGIKTHLPIDYVPLSDQAKYIYITRNPKDTCVSYYHHTKTVMYLFDDGEFDVYFDLFVNGNVDYGDYFDHVLGWYALRHKPNVLFLTYEELKQDTEAGILKIANFMGDDYAKAFDSDPEMMARVLKYSGVQHMKTLFNDGMQEMVGDMTKTAKDIDALNLPTGLAHARKFVLEHRTSSSKHLTMVRKAVVGDWRTVLSEEQIRRIDEKMNARLAGTDLLKFWKEQKCV